MPDESIDDKAEEAPKANDAGYSVGGGLAGAGIFGYLAHKSYWLRDVIGSAVGYGTLAGALPAVLGGAVGYFAGSAIAKGLRKILGAGDEPEKKEEPKAPPRRQPGMNFG